MKKAQVQINETILVLFIFLMILSIGLIGFYKYIGYSNNKLIEQDRINKFNNMIGVFANIPEIKCSYLNEDKECVDALKLLSYSGKGEFGNARVSVIKVYPESSKVECTSALITQGKDCGVFMIYDKSNSGYSNNEIIYSPVSLYYPNEDKYYLAQLKIEVFS